VICAGRALLLSVSHNPACCLVLFCEEPIMLKTLIRGRLAAFQRDYGYDVSYLRDLLDADLKAFVRFSRLRGISEYCRDLPTDAWHAVKVAGALGEDCGPCTQLMVTMAERAGVSAATLRAVLSADDSVLSDEVQLAVRFSRAVLARDAQADLLRDQVVARWGRRGLVTIAFAMVSARVFPTFKYALGHGRSCTRVMVAGTPLAVRSAARANSQELAC
jgi:hypothetical protein